MIPFQGVFNLYLAAVNLKFGLEITSEKNMTVWLFLFIWERVLGMRIFEEKTCSKKF